MKRDLYAEVSARIVAELDRGAAPWIKPWSATAGQNVTARQGQGSAAQSCTSYLECRFLSYELILTAVAALAPRDSRLLPSNTCHGMSGVAFRTRSRKSLSSLREPHGRTEMLVANGRTTSSGPAGRLEAFRNGAGSRLPNKARHQRLRS